MGGEGSGRRPGSLPAGHIGEISAGHARDEELRRREDTNAERVETDSKAYGMESIDLAKFSNIDNEIGKYFNVETRNIPVTNAQPGYSYCWALKTVPPGARPIIPTLTNVRVRDDTGKSWDIGYQVVEGDMPEARDHKGKDAAAGTSQRGVGDCVLLRIRNEFLDLLRRYWDGVAAKRGNPEASFVEIGRRYESRLGYNPAHANDAHVARVAGRNLGGPMEAATTTVRVNDKMIREGTIPGYEPGDDVGE